MSAELEGRLADLVRASPRLMHVLRTVRGLDLPDWLIFSGAVYQTVWNALTGRDPDYGVKDYDVGYFDPDTSWDAEDVFIKRASAAFAEPLADMVELRNQARVHLWFEGKFGEAYTPLTHTAEALERFVSPTFAVGVRLEADDRVSVAAPFGLEDVFALRLRPNPNRPLARGWAPAVASARARWPEIAVLA
ncbi:nucleotidyltransferase family protein [Caulobacter sp. 17J65-9]|uniref:nucleotidyltransferase family protein n=1 Tax=Caulobacter sp. 17J65-9 TaxID=2709382 RepID=UPI0013CB7F69|nr:nucleotidyltransferase family protein [Caulobacter sp. 17J65-9]NEX91654.1 nucleotidyltransferase family protein [Caulobacter sp. 17J65-9]